MKNLLKDIMTAAGYEFTKDNRSYHTRAINGVLESGKVTIEICEKGKVWNTAVKKYNLKIKAAGFQVVKYDKGGFTPFQILREIGGLLQFPAVKEKITSEVSLHTHCDKCQGQGIIPAFHYYCNGICFDCCGTGFSREKDYVKVQK